jgi:hypothetical protein
MKTKLRVLPLLLLAVLALMGLVLPASAQDMMAVSAESCDYGASFSPSKQSMN